MADIEQAVQDFLKADKIEKDAKNLREAARVLLLAEWERQGKPEKGIDPRINIVVPVKAATGARFDEERTMEAYALIEDSLGGDVANAIFEFHPKFRGAGIVLGVASTRPDLAPKLNDIIGQFIIPGTEASPMSPRVGKA